MKNNNKKCEYKKKQMMENFATQILNKLKHILRIATLLFFGVYFSGLKYQKK